MIPAETRALIEAKREAAALGYLTSRFVDGNTLHGLGDITAVSKAERARLAKQIAAEFPFPKVKRPLRVTLSKGATFSHEPRRDGDDCPFLVHNWQGERYSALGITSFIKNVDDILAIARMLSGEQEEVDLCEEII